MHFHFCAKFRYLSAFFFCLALAQALPLAAQSTYVSLNDSKTETRVDALLKQMTLEEKIGQLVQYSVGSGAGPGGVAIDYEAMLSKGQIGSLYNLTGAREVNALQKVAVEKSR